MSSCMMCAGTASNSPFAGSDNGGSNGGSNGSDGARPPHAAGGAVVTQPLSARSDASTGDAGTRYIA